MTENKQHDTRTARRPDCVTEIRMGNSVLVVSGYFKKDTTTTAATKWRGYWKRKPLLHRNQLIQHEPEHGKSGHAGERGRGSILIVRQSLAPLPRRSFQMCSL